MSQWNLKGKIPVKISDESGIKHYEVALINGSEEKILLNQTPKNKPREINFSLPMPKQNISHGDKLTFKITARDSSKSSFFMGNASEKTFEITIDTQIPRVNIIQMSNTITRGGAAAVVFYAHDDALATLSVTNGFQSFVVFPFYKENYFVGIIPWYIFNPSFKGAIIAQDKAGNTRRFNINFTRYNRNYRTSNIALNSAFIDGKIAEIIANENLYDVRDFKTPLAAFRYVNEEIRAKDAAKVAQNILNTTSEVEEFSVFKPMEGAKVVGLFGDHRKFSFNKEPAGESHHLGIDLASSKHAKVFASNDGVVVMNDELGVYGNVLIIEHGFGVASLYAHLSESFKDVGDSVKRGEVIAQTGASGFAFGDHLHFTMLIQGIESISNEWMDSKWLKININDVLNNAKQVIDAHN